MLQEVQSHMKIQLIISWEILLGVIVGNILKLIWKIIKFILGYTLYTEHNFPLWIREVTRSFLCPVLYSVTYILYNFFVKYTLHFLKLLIHEKFTSSIIWCHMYMLEYSNWNLTKNNIKIKNHNIDRQRQES